MRIVFEHGGANTFAKATTARLITLEQYQPRGKLFRCTYGLEVKDKLTYNEACKELGAAILHNACCEGKADNTGK